MVSYQLEEKLKVFVNYCNDLYAAVPPNRIEVDDFCCLAEILQLKLEHHVFLDLTVSILEIEPATDSLKIKHPVQTALELNFI